MGENKLLTKVEELRALLNEAKPGDRSNADRRIAILLTDLEKIEALIIAWGIVDKEVPDA
jgi:hypothetical protein